MKTTGVWCLLFFSALVLNGAATTRYVWTNSPSPMAPYNAWSNAAHEIQTAIDAAVTGDVVLVTNGVYTTGGKVAMGGTNRVVLDKALTVRSVNGPQFTFIVGSGPVGPSAVRCAYLENNASLVGFTLTNGYTTTTNDGAGVYCNGASQSIVSNCVITGCTSAQYGGGTCWGTIVNCLIDGNTALGLTPFYGGGGTRGGVIRNCRITRNTSSYWAGGACSSTLDNCLIDQNYCTYDGGGAYNCILRNCTVVSNSAWYAGGIRDSSAYSCIFYYNTARQGDASRNNVWNNFGGSCSYSCTTPAQSGTGNITGAPDFVDMSTNDYRLKATSPCVDAGSNLAWMVGALDLAGNPRIINEIVDMGAYEYDNAQLHVSFTGTPLEGVPPLPVVFTSTVGGTNQDNVYYQWDFNSDGTVDREGSNLGVVTNVYAAPAYYSVTLTIRNAIGETNATSRANYVRVIPSTVYVASSGGNQYPYTNWAMACTGLSNAVWAVASNGTIIVSNGNYAVSGELNINKPLTLRSVNGSGVTIIRRSGSSNHRVIGMGTGVTVDGFTISNGYINAHGAGVYINGGMLKNCKVTGNSNYEFGWYYGGGIYMSSGSVTNCVIEGNRAKQFGAGIYMASGLLSYCTISSNTMVANGGGVACYGNSLVEYCLIKDNVASDHGGGIVCNATSRNCLVINNTVTLNGGGAFLDAGRMQSCTIAGNSSATRGGGVCVGNADAKWVENTIIYDNTAPTGSNYAVRDGVNATFSSCCSAQVLPGSGNITNAPHFADTATDDYRVLGGSSTVDAGTNQDWMTDAVDLQGNPRILNNRVDMGAYELRSSPIMVSYPNRDLFCHDTRRLEWMISGIESNDARVTLTLTANGYVSTLVTNQSGASVYDWNTTNTVDGRYELKFILRNAAGTLLGQETRWAVVNNSVLWHSGTVTGTEVWATGKVHVVEGTLTLATNVEVSINAGAIVKMLPQSGFVIESGATLNLLVGGQIPVLTSIKDDTVGGDDNKDGSLSIPLPGDWRGFATAPGGTCYDEGADLRYIRVGIGGLLPSSTTWKRNTLIYVTNDVTVANGQRLTIEPGALVKFAQWKGIIVESGGELLAQGTLAQPITFTSDKDDSIGGDTNEDEEDTLPGPGDWGMVLVYGAATLDHVVLRYGGGNSAGVWNDTAMVKVIGSGSSATLNACRLSYALYDGFSSWNGGTALVANCSIYWNDRGVLVREGSTCTILNNTIYANRWGLCPHGGVSLIYNNVISRNTEYGIYNCCGGSWDIRYNDVWGSGTANYNSTPSVTNNNISVDPKLKNPSNEVFQLNFGSPAIDAADGTRSPYRDYMNNGRYTDPRSAHTGVICTNGQYADMGAFEFVENAASAIDLVADAVSAPVSATAGEQVTITWSVRNNGTETAAGSWHDSILFTPAQPGRWDVESEVTQVVSTASIGPGQSVAFSATVRVPGGTEGAWRWSVYANRLGEVFEGQNANNNRSAPSDLMTLSVPSLTVGAAYTGTYAAVGSPAWFKVTQRPGTNLLITLDSAATIGACTIYAGINNMPTTSFYDKRSAALSSPDARLEVQAASATQTLYVLIMPERLGGNGAGGYTLLADAAAFSLDRMSPSQAGNASPCTLTLAGSAFRPGVRAFLRPASGGLDREASAVQFVDSTLLYTTFELQAAVPGTYHAVVSQGGQERVLSNAFTVAGGGVGGELRTRILVPDRVRSGREFTGYVEYENIGDGNLTAPWLYLKSESGTSLLWEPGKSSQTADGLRFLASAQTGPKASVLIPGAVFRFEFRAIITGTSQARFSLYSLSDGNTGLMNFTLLQSTVTPQYTHPLWSNAWVQIRQMAGTTQGDYIAMLLDAADRARTFGMTLTSEQDILEFLVAEQFETVQDANVTGTVFVGDTNTPLPRAILTLTPEFDATGTGSVFQTFSWYDGTFGFRNVTPGRYVLSAENVWPDTLLSVTVESAPVSGLIAVADSELSGICGYVYADAIGGHTVSGAVVIAHQRGVDGLFSAVADSNGYYSISKIPPASYTMETSADGYPPSPTETIEVSGGSSYSYSPVVTHGSAVLRGVVHAEGGSPVSNAMVIANLLTYDSDNGYWHGENGVSDADGTFTFNVIPGTYRLAASCVGHGESAWTNVIIGPQATSAVITVSLTAPLALTGRVVAAESGSPLAGAYVCADTCIAQQAPIISDSTGHFVISNLSARVYEITAGAAGRPPVTTNVDLSSGTPSEIEITLNTLGTITGRVMNAGQPVSGAPVVALFARNDLQVMATTDAQGGYQFLRVPMGAYSVAVGSLGGLAAGRCELAVCATQLVHSLTHEFDVLALTGRVTDVQGLPASTNTHVALFSGNVMLDEQLLDTEGGYCFWMHQTGTYAIAVYATETLFTPQEVMASSSGVAYASTFTGGSNTLLVSLTDASSNPITNARVGLRPVCGFLADPPRIFGEIDANGQALFRHLPAGEYWLQGLATGYQCAARTVTVAAGSNAATIAFSPGCVLTGRVEAADTGELLREVRLDLCTATSIVVSTYTDTNGFYALSIAPTGTFTLVATPSWDYEASIRESVILTTGAVAQADFVLAVASTATLSGVVTNTQGQRVTDAAIRLQTASGVTVASTLSDTRGAFVLGEWPTGSYQLVTCPPGGVPSSMAIELAAHSNQTGVSVGVCAPMAAGWGDVTVESFAPERRLRPKGEIPFNPTPEMDANIEAGSQWLADVGAATADVIQGDLGLPPNPADTHFGQFGNNNWGNDFGTPLKNASDAGKVCTGVMDAYDEGWAWQNNIRKAYDAWYSSWDSMRQENNADVGLYLSKSGLLGAKAVKLAMSISSLASKMPGGNPNWDIKANPNIPIPAELQKPLVGGFNDLVGTIAMFSQSDASGKPIKTQKEISTAVKDSYSTFKVIDGSYQAVLSSEVNLQKSLLSGIDNLSANPAQFIDVVEDTIKPNMKRVEGILNSYKNSKFRKNGMMGLDIANALYDVYSLAEDYMKLRKELNQFPKDVADRAEKYVDAQKRYAECQKRYHEAKFKMNAAIANCKDSDSAKPKTPNPKPLNNPTKINEKRSDIPVSKDPNDKLTTGIGTGGYMLATDRIYYTIRFENVATSSAPAQIVTVTDTLTADLDWSTMQLGDMQFNNTLVSVPTGLTAYTVWTNVPTDTNAVRARAQFDDQSGVLTWTIESIDAVTQDLPEDPLLGFLPPNVTNGCGEGYVMFSVQARTNAASGTLITNVAKIVFDVNNPIWTPVASNRIDTQAPVSEMDALRPRSPRQFRVEWSGNDAGGSGVDYYDIYVSINSNAYSLWLTTNATEAYYTGEPRTNYRFLVRATDAVGNRENKTGADASTTVGLAVKNDFDGDGISDIGCYHAVDGAWFVQKSRDGFWGTSFGFAGTEPISADMDGDAVCDYGIYYALSGLWSVQRSTEGPWSTAFGYAGTTPVTGDFDGDGSCDFGCYYAPGGHWYIFKTADGFWSTDFGYEGTVPVTGDFDGDGIADFGCYYPPSGSWYIFKSRDGFWSTVFGYEGTVPVTGDFDGDTLCDFGCYDASVGSWYIYKSRDGFWSTSFGYEGTIPVTGDYDGDVIDDFGCYYPPSGSWYIYGSRDGFRATAFGYEGTVPLK